MLIFTLLASVSLAQAHMVNSKEIPLTDLEPLKKGHMFVWTTLPIIFGAVSLPISFRLALHAADVWKIRGVLIGSNLSVY